MRKGATWLRSMWEARHGSSSMPFADDGHSVSSSSSATSDAEGDAATAASVPRMNSASGLHSRVAHENPEGHFVLNIECAGQLERVHSNVFVAARVCTQAGRPKGKAVWTLGQMRTATPFWKVPRDMLAHVVATDIIIVELFSPDWTRPIAHTQCLASKLLFSASTDTCSNVDAHTQQQNATSGYDEEMLLDVGIMPSSNNDADSYIAKPAPENHYAKAAARGTACVVHLPLWHTVRTVPGHVVLKSLPFDSNLHFRKRIFLIRHAQSRWNEAQATRKYAGIFAYDHPLTPEGARQALALRSSWQSSASALARKDGDHHDENEEYGDEGWLRSFLQAHGLLCSPMTRALQTAVLALEGHPAADRGKMELLPSLRELKSRGGLDSVGKATGNGVLKRCEEKLIEVVGETKAKTALHKWAVDYDRVSSEWWTPADDADGDTEATERVTDILNAARFLVSSQSVIAVGHSGIFNSMCRKAVSNALLESEESPVNGQMLVNGKLSNASVLGLDVAFSSTGAASIVDARLLFNSSLIDLSQNQSNQC